MDEVYAPNPGSRHGAILDIGAHDPKPTRTALIWIRSVIIGALILPTALLIVVAWRDRTMVMKQAGQNVLSSVTILQEHAFNVLETHDLVGALVNERIRGMSWEQIAASEDLRQYLSAVVHDYPQTRAVWLCDASGQLRNASAVFPVPQLNVSDRDYYAPLRDRDTGVFIGRFVHGRVLHEDAFSVARRRSGATGDFDGLIVVSVSPSYYTKFWQQLAIQDGAFGGMIRDDGAIVAREPPASADMLLLGAANPLMKAVAKGNFGLNRDVAPLDGVERIYAIRQVPDFPVYVAYGLSVSTILKLWYDHLLTYVEFTAVATLGLAMVGMVALRKARHEYFVLHQWHRTARQLDQEARQRVLLEDELAQVLRRTVSDQEAERLRIARELHDTLGQSVTLFNLGLERLGPTTTGGQEFQKGLAALKDMTLQFSHDIHRLAWEIRPRVLDDLGIETAIRTLLETWSEQSGLAFDLHLAVDGKRPSPDVETTLYRVLQEALTNVTRHARATRVDIVLRIQDPVITMIIEDDGRGFISSGPGCDAVPAKRLGLLGIRERLALVQGFLEIESAPGAGTSLFIRIVR